MDKMKKVMGEFKRKSLRSSSGKKVTSRKQAIAIAMSEARAAGQDVGSRPRSTDDLRRMARERQS